ncbi:Predicted transcriptional regulator [Streptomyces atratus]|jgi:predicted transcriptional regulator|uniref:Predicted transcriptional regulator n=1 Tax=Streptomyces atratus TaxID=1893 RepID=A0A1K1Y558_STRAR|nr:Predicted transcriptional regulator [Streptomyces atratus]
MSQVKGIASGEPDPRPHGDPASVPTPQPAPRHPSPPSAASERRPAGELESTILAALWAAGTPLTPGQVQGAIGAELARTTVTTILSRLYEKGTVARTRAGRGFVYTPTEDAPGLTARRMHSELRKQEDRSTVLARFVSQLTDEDEQLLRELLDGETP